MTTRTDDQSVVQRVLDHIEHGTTDTGADVWREPVANYRSESRLAEELAVLRRVPVPFCPSAALPENGSYVSREAAGVPLLVVRGADGKVRAFRNACRHRGTQLANGAGCAKSFVCPYHAWTYNLDGGLRHVPHQDGFPGLDKSTHGLVPVHAEERLGLVFVCQEKENSIDKELPPLLRPGRPLFATTERELDVNWKVFLEGFIEGYHIRFTHPESFFPYGFDNLNVIDFFGRSSRITYPFKRIQKLEKVAPEQRKVDGLLTYVYHVFPNVLITILSRHTNVVILEPLGVSRTRQINYTLANDAGEEALAEAKRDQDFVGNVGAVEDLAVVTSIQKSIGSGANEVFTFGKYESCIVHFHRALGAALGRQQGFSLLTALVTLALVSFGLLALVRYQSSLFASEAVARDRTEAQMLARQTLDRVYAMGNPEAFGSGADDVQGRSATFKRRWTLATGAMGNTSVDVTVNWTDARGASNDVRLSSVVYKNNAWNQGMLALASDPVPAAPGATIFTTTPPPSNKTQAAAVSSQDPAAVAAATPGEKYHITGSILGSGGAGVTVAGTNDAACTVTGGEFDCTVPGAWSGIITVNTGQSSAKVAPSAASYSNVTGDIPAQNFVIVGP